MKYKVLRQVSREGKYELWCDVLDDSDNLLVGNHIVHVGKDPLDINDKTTLDSFFSSKVFPAFTIDESVPAPETVDEVYDKLVNKGYLQSGQTIDALPTKTELISESTVVK